MILSVSNIQKSFNEVPILQNISFHIEDYDKAAIVGVNGAGKTTLLRIIMGELPADDGIVTVSRDKTIGYLSQHEAVSGENTIFEELLRVKQNILDMETQIHALELQMKNASGEKLDQLETFHPSRMASRILGMGDVLSLIERAEMSLDEKKAAELERKLAKNKFDLNDLLDQFDQIERMGSLRDTIKMLPGIGSKIKDEDIDEGAFNRFRSIIYSMTVEERTKPEIINPSRKRRIAAGCGMQVEDVNRLLKSFEQMRKMMKQFSGPGMGKKMKRLSRMGGFGGGFPGL